MESILVSLTSYALNNTLQWSSGAPIIGIPIMGKPIIGMPSGILMPPMPRQLDQLVLLSMDINKHQYVYYL